MKFTDSSFLVAAKWIFAFLLSFWVGIPLSVQTLVICMALDFATGMIAAFIRRELASHKGSRGIAKKVLILILVATSHIITEVLKLPFDLGVIVASAYIVNEVISITENCANSGVPVPPALLKVLLKARQITGRNISPTEVVEKLEQVIVKRPDGLGGEEQVISSRKTITGMPPEKSEL